MKNKLKSYEIDRIKSQQRIVELEDLNNKLEKRLRNAEVQFLKDSINMN